MIEDLEKFDKDLDNTAQNSFYTATFKDKSQVGELIVEGKTYKVYMKDVLGIRITTGVIKHTFTLIEY